MRDIHVRYEDSETNPNTTIAAGITLHSLELKVRRVIEPQSQIKWCHCPIPRLWCHRPIPRLWYHRPIPRLNGVTVPFPDYGDTVPFPDYGGTVMCLQTHKVKYSKSREYNAILLIFPPDWCLDTK